MRNSIYKNALIKSRRKLASDKGASISYALLLFLVCAALSAVIVVAGTASAGRLARLAETDQKYYAVTSAAELLSTELDNGALSKVTVKTGTNTTQDVYFAKKMNEITDEDFQIAVVNTSEQTQEEGDDPGEEPDEPEDDNQAIEGDASDLVIPASDDSNGLAASIFSASQGATFTLSSTNESTDPLAVTIKVEEKTNNGSYVLLSVADGEGTNTGKGHFKTYLHYSVHTQDGKPPVTKLEDDKIIVSGEEITWDLIKMMTSYDK